VAVVVSMDGPTGMGSGCKFQVTWTCGGTAYRIGGGCGPPGDEPDGGYYGVCVDNGTQTSTFDFSTMTCDCKDPQALATLVQAKCLSQ
jgi:hypothetical protein